MTAANLLTEWASLLFASLADAGVKDVVISPGSRSTPFSLAVARTPRLRVQVAIDERAASFIALGQARLTGVPSVLLCTSGTAAAHYYPAVIEASTAYIPLLVITADRPPELQGCAAPQTIDQIKLYGGYARQFFDLGMPEEGALSLRALRRSAAQAVLASMHPLPGAVHLNARARKPLEPVLEVRGEAETRLQKSVASLLATPIVDAKPPVTLPDPSTLEALVGRCASVKRGIIACGPVSPTSPHVEQVLELARTTGYPILCEATSQLRFTTASREGVVLADASDAIVRATAFSQGELCPELVVQVGPPMTSGAWDQFLGTRGPERTVIAAHGWNDPQNGASSLLFGDVHETLRALNTALRRHAIDVRERAHWGERWSRANRAAWRSIATKLASAPQLLEGHVVRGLLDRIPASSVLAVGNSLSVRELELFGESSPKALRVLCQRGANGIDGLVAGAFGSATVAGAPVTLLLGDVSFLHDLNSLMLPRTLSHPFVVVVLQNQGGRIFELLPIGKVFPPGSPELQPVVTPHAFTFRAAAELFGHAYRRVDTPAGYAEALADAYTRPQCTLIEAVVPAEHAAARHHELYRQLGQDIDAELAPART